MARHGRSLRCPAGHSFDLARQGYVTLAAAPIRHPGDTAAMLAARMRVLDTGLFHPLTQTVVDATGRDARLVVEVGAGPAQHLAAVLTARQTAHGVAMDSSKAAAKLAARAHERIQSVRCDITGRLPLLDGSVDVVLCVFAPRNIEQFERIMRPGGDLVIAYPTPAHLLELRQAMDLLDVAEDKYGTLTTQLTPRFDLVDRTDVVAATTLDKEAVTDMVLMGPNAFHRTADEVSAQAAALAPIATRLSVAVERWRLRPATGP